MISLYDVGQFVIPQQMPPMQARILSKTNGSVSVEVWEHFGRRRHYLTSWSPMTIVRKSYSDALSPELDDAGTPVPQEPTPPKTPSPTSPSQPPTTQPQEKTGKPKAKPEKATAEAPKAKAEKDVFGVRMGSMASAVNAYLLKKRKDITVADILTNVPGSKKDNVNSHLRRMIGDGLLVNKGKEKDIKVNVPKEYK